MKKPRLSFTAAPSTNRRPTATVEIHVATVRVIRATAQANTERVGLKVESEMLA